MDCVFSLFLVFFFVFKQKTAYELRISDWSSDVCSSDLEARAGFPIRLLSGDEEARLSALGVVAGIPDADGLVGDLGGGSLELIDVRGGGVQAGGGQDEVRRQTSLPLGPFRLMREGKPEEMVEAIDRHLDTVPWMDEAKGRTL